MSFNRYLLKNTGYSEEELIGKSAVDIFVPDDEETRYQFYEIINKGGERLIATVNDLIDISQIETQQIKVNKTAFSISELLSTLLYGSTFFFNIPKDEIVADKAETNIPEDKEKRLKQYSKILVAEDDEMNYLFLKNLLEHKGFGIVHAWNGEEAVEMLRNDDDISLVLMDIKMPVMSGEEATRQIRTFNQDIPIIAQTAYAMPSDRSKLLEIGCNDYISKPIVTDSLVKLLQKHVNPSG